MKSTRYHWPVIGLFALMMHVAPGYAQRAAKAKIAPRQVTPATINHFDFFPDFPRVKMGMSFADAKKAIKASGGNPVHFKTSQSEFAWEGTFAGVAGRGTMLFKPKTGAWEIAVVLYAIGERQTIYDAWIKKIEARHGPTTEILDEEAAISRVWRFKDKTALEIRLIKDVNSPVLDIHWVRL